MVNKCHLNNSNNKNTSSGHGFVLEPSTFSLGENGLVLWVHLGLSPSDTNRCLGIWFPIASLFSIFTSVLSLEQYWTIKSLLVLLFFRINNSRSLIKEAYDCSVVPLWCPRASGLIKTGRDSLVSLSDIGWASPDQVVLFWLSEASVPGLQLCSCSITGTTFHHLLCPK